MGNANVSGAEPGSDVFQREFQCELNMAQCLVVRLCQDERQYEYAIWGSPSDFALTVPLMDALCEAQRNPDKLRAAQLSGDIFGALQNNPVALESLLEAMVDLPKLMRLRIILPSGGNNLGRLMSILRKVMRKVSPNLVEVDHTPSLLTGLDDVLLRLMAGSVDLLIRAEGIDNAQSMDRRIQKLLNPLVQEVLQLPSITEFSLTGNRLGWDTFQKIFETSNLESLVISKTTFELFEISVIVSALSTSYLTNSSRRKRKLGQALGTLDMLLELEFNQVDMDKEMVRMLLNGLESNDTLERFALIESTITSPYENDEELWTQVASLLKCNKTLHSLEISDVTDSSGRLLGQDFGASLSKSLEDILRNHNQSLYKLHFGREMPVANHSDAVYDLLHLNTLKLRPLLGKESDCSKLQLYNALIEAMEITWARTEESNCDFDSYEEDEVLQNTDELPAIQFISSMFLVFQANPSLVRLIEEDNCAKGHISGIQVGVGIVPLKSE